MPKPLTVWITTNWKILKEMGIPDDLTCLLRNLYAGQEATVKNWTLNNGLVQNQERSMSRLYIVTLLILLICRVHHVKCWAGWITSWNQGIKIARRNINNLRYADDITLMAESKEELKSFLMKVKEESEKAGLELNIQKTKIMASSPITSWQVDKETMETATLCFDLFWAPKSL